jgi:aminomethyltransferase
MSELKHSPLEPRHKTLGAKLVPFAGWNMPVQYTSIIDEHTAVRNHAGIFDISHMGQFFVSGSGSIAWLNQMLTNNVEKLRPGQGQYTLMLHPSGGVIDDLIAYRAGEQEFFLVVNASMIDEDFAWLARQQPENCSLRNESNQWAGMAIQGPHAAVVYASTLPSRTLPPRHGIQSFDGLIVCRTGYTGEDGFEFFCAADQGPLWWDRFLAAGAKPCGLGARDSLRLEMGYPLNGNDLSPERSPIEAGLGFFCDLSKPDFIGRETLVHQKSTGPALRLTALQATGKAAPPRAHYPVYATSGEQIGELCSGVLSPSLMKGIALAYLPASFSQPGTEVFVDVRGRQSAYQVVPKPFYRK